MAIGPILREARLKKQLTESQVAEMTRMKIQIVQDLENDDFHRLAATIYGKGFIKLFAECVDLDPAPLIADYVRSVSGDAPSLITRGVDNPGGMSRPQPLPPPEQEKQEPPVQEAPTFDFSEIKPEPEQDAEDDLFAYTKKKNTIEDDSVIPPPAPEPETVVSEKTSNPILGSIKQKTADSIASIRSTSGELLNKLADISWGDAPIKIVSIVIGSMVIILILAISIGSCRSRSITPAIEDNSLQTPVPPPEPYFD
jgi:transcriptional regulator with XRE-family HTH domain